MNHQLLHGNSLDVLGTLADESVHAVICSPPYYGKRNYQTGVWWGGESACQHELKGHKQVNQTKNKAPGATIVGGGNRPNFARVCRYCGAEYVDEQIGLESLYDCLGWATNVPCGKCYVCSLVAVMRQVRRVLRADGTLWLNLGDSYYGGKGKSSQAWSSEHLQRETLQKAHHHLAGKGETRVLDAPQPGLKPKNLIGMPWRVALALQADGWYLRSEVIWAKAVSFLEGYSGTVMPESVKDRPTVGHETVFLLSKSEHYFFDYVAVQEQAMADSARRYRLPLFSSQNHKAGAYDVNRHPNTPGVKAFTGKRNLRTVWVINPSGNRLTHYAKYPEALVEPMILASTSAKGVCKTCGAPWERVTQRAAADHSAESKSSYPKGSTTNRLSKLRQTARAKGGEYKQDIATVSWRPTCACVQDENDLAPAVVCDPFLGSGTTLVVAKRHGRDGIGVDLSEEYIALASVRLTEVQAPLLVVT